MNSEKKRLKAIIMVGHSNAGKTSLCEHILRYDKRIRLSVSATTRPQRTDEINAKHYYFMKKECFEKLIKEDAFIEWDLQNTGHRYGTLKSEVTSLNNAGYSILFDVNPKGADSLREYFKDEAVTLFVTVPGNSLEEKQQVLLQRAQASSTRDELDRRIARVYDELLWAKQREIDHYVENHDLARTCQDVTNIISFTKRELRRPILNVNL